MRAPTARAYSSARTRFTLTFFSALPPPTENTSRPSMSDRRLPRSQAANAVSQPSSLMRAVSSETLSVGAYASKTQILRKSLTAWPAWPAPPPTPRMNRRPPASRTAASPAAIASICPASSARMMSTASARYVAANDVCVWLSVALTGLPLDDDSCRCLRGGDAGGRSARQPVYDTRRARTRQFGRAGARGALRQACGCLRWGRRRADDHWESIRPTPVVRQVRLRGTGRESYAGRHDGAHLPELVGAARGESHVAQDEHRLRAEVGARHRDARGGRRQVVELQLGQRALWPRSRNAVAGEEQLVHVRVGQPLPRQRLAQHDEADRPRGDPRPVQCQDRLRAEVSARPDRGVGSALAQHLHVEIRDVAAVGEAVRVQAIARRQHDVQAVQHDGIGEAHLQGVRPWPIGRAPAGDAVEGGIVVEDVRRLGGGREDRVRDYRLDGQWRC